MFCAEHLYRPTCMLALLLARGLFGQELPVSLSTLLIKSGTPVELRLAETISSEGAHKGDRLEFAVVNDVVIGGFTVIRTGALAIGSIVGVNGKRPLGIGGNLAF